MKKLPSVYKNITVKSTNKKMFYSEYEKKSSQEVNLQQEIGNIFSDVDTNQVLEKLNALFQRRKHAYTDIVEMKTKDKILKTRLVFMTGRKVVTIDNEEIDLNDIVSIRI